jgi:hypothetical protein
MGMKAHDLLAKLAIEARHDRDDENEHHDSEHDAHHGNHGNDGYESSSGTKVTKRQKKWNWEHEGGSRRGNFGFLGYAFVPNELEIVIQMGAQSGKSK